MLSAILMNARQKAVKSFYKNYICINISYMCMNIVIFIGNNNDSVIWDEVLDVLTDKNVVDEQGNLNFGLFSK